MNLEQRYKKLRRLASKVNRARKKQAQQIDILCNDFIAAQRDFIKRLGSISFAAHFYQSITGIRDLNGLFHTAGQLIYSEIKSVNIAFFLRQSENFDLQLFESSQPITFEKQKLESCFTPELVDNICKSNKLLNIDGLLAVGLKCSPAVLNELSIIAIPLSQHGSSLGFMLIYSSSQNDLTETELEKITSVTPGLARAIASCKLLSFSAD